MDHDEFATVVTRAIHDLPRFGWGNDARTRAARDIIKAGTRYASADSIAVSERARAPYVAQLADLQADIGSLIEIRDRLAAERDRLKAELENERALLGVAHDAHFDAAAERDRLRETVGGAEAEVKRLREVCKGLNGELAARHGVLPERTAVPGEPLPEIPGIPGLVPLDPPNRIGDAGGDRHVSPGSDRHVSPDPMDPGGTWHGGNAPQALGSETEGFAE